MILTRRSFLAAAPAAALPAQRRLAEREDALLEDLSHRSFQFLWEQADASTGLIRDRALADSGAPDKRTVASSAATGFGLAGICIAAERGWVARSEARGRILAALRYYAEHSVHERGWFYHFVDAHTGERKWNCEISSIDTILLLAGMLTASGYFSSDGEISRLVRLVWDRIDFQWMLNGDANFLSMGWRPENGFVRSRWDHHCELLILYVLAIGSRTKPLPLETWYAWRRPTVNYGGYSYISGAPALFVHQFSQAFIDFRDHPERRSPGVNWFDNSVKATLAQRRMCVDLRERFPGYGENIWGLTSSDSAKGYVAWGGPPATSNIDGTVVPCAAGGSLMLAPEVCVPAVMEMRQRFGDRIYKRYGFVDAFHPTNGWTNPDVIGIDVGITLLSAENLRTGNVWRWFHRNAEVQSVMTKIFL